MLGDAISRSFLALWPNEVFHDGYADPELDFRSSKNLSQRLGFFNFRHDVLKTRPELSMPSPANQSLLLTEYLEYLATSERADRYLLDVKHTSWHHLEPYWRIFYDRPHMLSEAMRLRLPLVHLKRSNLFALYCSQKFAMETDVWHVLENRAGSDHGMTIDVAHCVSELQNFDAAQRMFDRWLADYPVHELVYEALLTPGGFAKNVEQAFIEIYGVTPVQPLSTVYRKVTPPLRDVVINKDEVLSALRGTDFRGMAEEAALA